MLARELKLRLTKKQEKTLSDWLWNLTGVYNFAIRKIELDAKDKIFHSKMDFQNILSEHGRKLGIPSHTLQGTLVQAWLAWNRCFKKIAKKPKLKSIRNKLNSIPFPDPLLAKNIEQKIIGIPGIGKIRYFKQEIPKGKIKNARIIRRASGWYCVLTIDADHVFKVKKTNKKVGIDTGFKTLATLSDGTEIPNHRYYIERQKRLGQAQRGKRKKLTARLHERIKNRRKDHNHKVSRQLVEKYSVIKCVNDNLKGQAKLFGKSVGDAGISQLINFTSYKSVNHNRKFQLIDSRYTTMTCSNPKCLAKTGPHGLEGLKVREWVCSACGAVHKRDVNSAKIALISGSGSDLVSSQEY